MPRTVQELMTQPAITCRRSDDAAQAARLMSTNDCGCVFVVDREVRLVGTITDRDICLSALEMGVPLSGVPVARAMSPIAFSCRPTDTVEAVMRLMKTRRIRRVPVVDDDGRLLGIVSLSDLAREAARAARDSDYGITNDDIGLTLGAICWGPVGERDADALSSQAESLWESEGNPNAPTRIWHSNEHQRPKSGAA